MCLPVMLPDTPPAAAAASGVLCVGLVLQSIISSHPQLRGSLLGPDRADELRAKWHAALSRAHDCRAGVRQGGGAAQQHEEQEQCER